MLDTEIQADRVKAGLGDDFSASARPDSGKHGRGRGRVTAAVAAAEGVPEKKRRGRKKTLQEDDEDGAHCLSLAVSPSPGAVFGSSCRWSLMQVSCLYQRRTSHSTATARSLHMARWW